MSLDITALAIKVTSEGIALATQQLNELAQASSKVERQSGSTSASQKSLEASMRSSVASVDKLLAQLTRQADLLGANKSQTAAYDAALRGATVSEYNMAKALGAEVDAYKALGAAQVEAIRMNKALDAENKKLMKDSVAEIKRKESAAYKELAQAQAEAIRMNKAIDAENQKIMKNSLAEIKRKETVAYRELSQAHSEALRMNKAMDDATNKSTKGIRNNNEAMKEAHALARGLTGSLGQLWLSYGNVAGIAVGVAIGASLKGIVTVGKDVEHTLENIRVKGEATTEAINQMRDAVYNLGSGIYGPIEVSKAFEILTLAGLKASESLLAVKSALNLATAGGTSIETAATALVTIGTAVGATASQYDYLADVITKTSNISLASVESVAASMKRASVVNKLYGATFEDIATQVAALAQLGIKDSAAGTAITNFYTNSVGATEKAKKALKELGMEFTDATGRAKPLALAFEEFSEKLSKYDLKSQGQFIEDVFGERAKRDLIAVMDLTKTAAENSKEYANRLREIQGEIAKAAGTAALASTQLALTSENQLKSVSNTLQVSFAKAFKAIEPDLNIVAMKLRQAFGSQEFVNGITSIASGVANLTVFLTENWKAVVLVIDAFVMWKAVTIGASLFTTIATGLTGVAASMGLVTVATNGAITSVGLLSTALRFLPGIGIILTAVTAGFALFNLTASKGKDHANETAKAYNTNYLSALKEEAERLEKTTKLIKDGQSVKDAELNVTKEMALATARLNNQKAIANANEEVALAKKSGNWRAVVEAEKNRDRAINTSFQFEKDVVAYADRVIAASAAKKKAYEAEEAARIAKDKAAAGGVTRKTEDKHASNDQYAKDIQKNLGIIRNAEEDFAKYKEDLNLKLRAGDISRLKSIEMTTNKELQMLRDQQKVIEANIKLAQDKKDKSDEQTHINALEENRRRTNAALISDSLEVNAALAEMARENTRTQIKELEKQGKFGEAERLRFSSENQKVYADAKKALEEYGDIYPEITTFVKNFDAAQQAAFQSGSLKELKDQFEGIALQTQAALRAVEEMSESAGIGAMVEAGIRATAAFEEGITKLQGKMIELSISMSFDPKGGTDAQKKLMAEMQKEVNSEASKFSKMWEGIGENIGRTLERAFGRGGKAIGEMIGHTQKYDKVKDKSAQSELNHWGKMASSASGFFNEQSKGYKVLNAVSQAFHAAEMVLMIAKIQKLGIAAVLTQGQGEPFSAPARMAAMVAAVAALGVALSAGGGGGQGVAQRQAAQGTGSVLGDKDAKSESIANSLSILEKNSGLGLVHSNTMIGHLKTVADGISGLAAIIARTSGITSGNVTGITTSSPSFFQTLFGSSKTTIKDQGITGNAVSLGGLDQFRGSSFANVETSKWWGLSKSSSTQTSPLNDAFNTQFKLIVDGMAKSIAAAGDMLGVGGDKFKARLDAFVVDIGTISLKGLSGEEVENQLKAVFGKIGDDMAMWVLSGFTEFQKVGEGYLETVSRIANELVQVRDVFAVLGQTLNVTGGEAVKISQGLISAAGGLEALTEGTKFFVDNFLTDQEKLEPIQRSVNERLKELNMTELTSLDLYKKKVQGLNLNVEADQKLYAELIKLAPAFKTVMDGATKAKNTTEIANKARELEIRIMEAQGDAAGALEARRKDELKALNDLDPSLKTLQETLNKQLDLNAKEATERENAKSARALEIELMELQGKSVEALAEKRKDELAVLTPALAAQKELIHAQIDANTAAAKEQEKNRTARGIEIELMEAQGNAAGVLEARRKEELAALTELDPVLAKRKQEVYDQIDANTAAAKKTEIANTKRGIEIDLMEAQGDAAGVLKARREDELAAVERIDPALVGLKKNLHAAEDAAKAAAKALEINNKKDEINLAILSAQGKESEVLTIQRNKELAELEKLSPELVILQKQLYNITDAATAAAKALEISNKMYDLDIELLQARGQDIEATKMIRRRELAELTKLAPALAKKKQDVYDALDAAQIAKAKEERLTTAKADLVASLNQQADAIRNTVDNLKQAIDKFKGFSESIKKFKASLLLSDKTTLSPLQQYEEAKRQFMATKTLATTGDELALANLESVSGTFLEASKGYFASTEAYVADFNLVQAALSEGAAAADTRVVIMQAQLSAAEAQLAGIEAEVKLLTEVKELLSVQKARENLAAASTPAQTGNIVIAGFDTGIKEFDKAAWQQEQLSNYTKQITSAGYSDVIKEMLINSYKSTLGIDGSHYDGLDYVPKDGYIAELHKGERVQTAKTVSNQDANNAELVALTKELLTKISKIEDNTGGANMQRSAAHVEMAEIMETVASKMDEVKRAVKSTATK